MDVRLGYACINMQLADNGIQCNRGMIKRTFKDKGTLYASQLALQNIEDLFKIVQWNSENDFHVYRISSSLFPWMSEYEITELPLFNEIEKALRKVGEISLKNNQRLSFHPGQFDVLCSHSQKTVDFTILDLNQHAQILDIMQLPVSTEYPINIHLGGAYGDKKQSMDRFCKNFSKLSESARKRLIIENDDKASLYSVKDLYHGVHEKIGIPITFDYHHHRFCDSGLNEEEALKLASKTWSTGIRQMTHYSSSKKTFEDKSVKVQAHADYIYEVINNYELNIDIEVESKTKEISVQKYRKDLEKGLLLNEYLNFN